MQEKDSAELLLLALKVAEQFLEARRTCGQLPAVGQVRQTDSPQSLQRDLSSDPTLLLAQ